jgi:2-hydroxychromene-2-carboxylate isomerase
MKELDFSLATTEEIMKEFGRLAKQKRKQDMEYYGDQKKFAKHIGMTHRRYQQFEMNGKITLEKFIDVLRGLNALDEIQGLLELGDEELFKEKNHKKETKSFHSFSNKKHTKEINKDDKIVNIPDVFS